MRLAMMSKNTLFLAKCPCLIKKKNIVAVQDQKQKELPNIAFAYLTKIFSALLKIGYYLKKW